jgi:hypothetical protein
MQKVWANYKKPTPIRWRKIGDFALIMIPVIQTSLLGAPEGIFSDHMKFWVGVISSITLTGIKFFTNTFVEKTPTEE